MLAQELVVEFSLQLARVWLLEPPDSRDARAILAATAAAQPTTYGGLREPFVTFAMRSMQPAAQILATPSTDAGFEGKLPEGGFVGFPVVLGDVRFGYIEAYPGGTVSFSLAGGIERRAEDFAQALDSARATLSAESPRRGRILIADDDDGIRSLLRRLLGQRGFEVTDVANGRDAFVAAKRSQPDLIMLDWVMPDMDGQQATKRLKDDPETQAIPIVMLTSQARIDDKVQALQAGVQDFITKPFDSRELVARIEQQMRWRKLLSAANSSTPSDSSSAVMPAPQPLAAESQNAGDASAHPGDLWNKAVNASQLGKHDEALALFLQEAERCEEGRLYGRAAIAYRSGSVAAAKSGDAELSNKVLRLAGKMYLLQAESSKESRVVQDAYLSAARCFLASGNLQLAKKSIDSAWSIESVLADDRPTSLGG